LKDGSVGECAEQVISERAWVMAKEKTKGEELSAIGKQTMAHAYSAMDYYFDHLKKTVASAPSGGTEFGEKVKACAEQNIAATQEFVRDLSYALSKTCFEFRWSSCKRKWRCLRNKLIVLAKLISKLRQGKRISLALEGDT
jgi:hypothetical protein